MVFDDSEGQSRVALQRHASAHQGTAELNMGHLRHQSDNQRLAAAGFGAELKTEHSAAVRAGQGLLLTANARNNGAGSQLDSREAQTQLEQSHQLQMSLATTAQKHNASIKDEQGKAEAAPEKLPAIAGTANSMKVLESAGAGGGGGAANFGGGEGQVTAYSVMSCAALMLLVLPTAITALAGVCSHNSRRTRQLHVRAVTRVSHAASGKVSSQSQFDAAGSRFPAMARRAAKTSRMQTRQLQLQASPGASACRPRSM